MSQISLKENDAEVFRKIAALKLFHKIRSIWAAMDSFFSKIAEAQSAIVLR